MPYEAQSLSRRSFIKAGISAAALFAVGGGAFLSQPKIGARPQGERKERILASPHFVNGAFQNLEPIAQLTQGGDMFKTLWDIVCPTKGYLVPEQAILHQKTDLYALDPSENVVVWMGHSSFYLQMHGKRLLIDPVFSAYASPVFFINRAFAGSNVYHAEDIPPLDALVLSHDHWDHLDYATVMALKPKVQAVLCPLGVGAHFEAWGFPAEIIHEGDWNDEIPLAPDFSVHILPSRHFSGRLFERNQTEWCGFAFVAPNIKVYYSGDGGYGQHFKTIGEKFGSFDLAIMEDGQYNKHWPLVHMFPRQTAQAIIDVHAQKAFPVHAGKFVLSNHRWQAPYEKLLQASVGKDYALLTPEIGEKIEIQGTKQEFNPWWRAMD